MKIGNSGLTPQEFRATYNNDDVKAQRAMNKQMNCANNIAQLQQAGAMFGLNLDTSSVFQIADINNDGYISNKEMSSGMARMSQLAQMNSMQGAQSSGGSGAMGFLNGLTDVAGNILGTGGGQEQQASSNDGGLLGGVIKFAKGLFS